MPEEPEDIKALVLAPDAIIVSWRPPRKPNGLVQTYTVYGKLKESSVSSTKHFRNCYPSIKITSYYIVLGHAMHTIRKAERFQELTATSCQFQSKENLRRVSVPSGQLYHEVRNLRSGQRYEFWVTASTSVGEGPPSKRALQTPDTKGKFVSHAAPCYSFRLPSTTNKNNRELSI